MYRTHRKNRIHPPLARFALAGAFGLLFAMLITIPAFAHTRVEVGPYTIVVGWLNEPVIVGERNALVLEITEGETPVEGVEGALELTVFYGGESFIGQLAPGGVPGVYTAEIFPTLRGQYEVQLIGSIRDEAVDVILEPEEVLPADVLQFPESLPDPVFLTGEVERLTAALDRLQTATFLASIAGGLGLVVAIVALFVSLRRR